jgi:hypothetical protein
MRQTDTFLKPSPVDRALSVQPDAAAPRYLLWMNWSGHDLHNAACAMRSLLSLEMKPEQDAMATRGYAA